MTDDVSAAAHRLPEAPPRRTGRFWIIPLIAIGAFVVFFAVLTVQAYLKLSRGSGDGIQGRGLTADASLKVGSDVAKALQHTDDDPSWGTASAPVQVVAFEDFQCPFCKEAYPIVRQVLTRYQDRVYFVYRDFPLSSEHPMAQSAAEAGQCAWEQGQNQFWSLHDRIYQNQDALSEANLVAWAELSGVDRERFLACLTSGKYQEEVREDFTDGIAAGVRGTPTFFINGRKIEGVIPLDAWETLFRKL